MAETQLLGELTPVEARTSMPDATVITPAAIERFHAAAGGWFA